jgi:hypothetical protein
MPITTEPQIKLTDDSDNFDRELLQMTLPESTGVRVATRPCAALRCETVCRNHSGRLTRSKPH